MLYLYTDYAYAYAVHNSTADVKFVSRSAGVNSDATANLKIDKNQSNNIELITNYFALSFFLLNHSL